MDVNYCLKILLPGKDNPSGKSKKRYNGRLWRIQWWFKPSWPPRSGCGGSSGSGAGITEDDTSGMPKHVPLVTYLN